MDMYLSIRVWTSISQLLINFLTISHPAKMPESWHPTGSSPTYIRMLMISISLRLHQDLAYNQWIYICLLYSSTHQPWKLDLSINQFSSNRLCWFIGRDNWGGLMPLVHMLQFLPLHDYIIFWDVLHQDIVFFGDDIIDLISARWKRINICPPIGG